VIRSIRAFLPRDAAIATSYKLPFAADIAGAAFALLEFLFIGKLVPTEGSQPDYFAFVTAGLIVSVVVATGASAIALAVRQEQSQGTLEPILAAGLPPRELAVGFAAFPLVTAVARALVYLLLAVLFGARFPDASWSTVGLALGLGTLAFAGLGLIAVAVVIVLRQASAVIAWVIGLLTFAAGTVFPPELLPAWLQTISAYSPVTVTLDLVRRGMLDGVVPANALADLAILAVMTVISVVAGVGAVGLGLRWARRSGSVTGY
jgi:ABC-2 type transport system permease protein